MAGSLREIPSESVPYISVGCAAADSVDYVLVTDHASFISPAFFNASLDSFVAASEVLRPPAVNNVF
jgi:hypothetical protein